jgi:hypothetical protein
MQDTILFNYKEHKQEKAVTYLQANKIHTSIHDQEQPQTNTSTEETSTHNYYNQTKHIRIYFIYA